MGVASTPEHIIRDKRLSVGAKATWTALSSYANGFYGHKHVWPSQETLADDLCVTARCVRNWIGELEAADHLHVIRQNTRGGRESNVYVLHFPQEECQQEAQRNSGSGGVPMGSASPEEAHRKPAGSPEEAHRNAGSSKVLEGSEGLEGSKISSAPVKPSQQPLISEADKSVTEKRSRSVAQNPPTVEEVATFFAQHFPAQSDAIAADFVNYWTDNGWKRGKTPMVSWKGTAATRAQMLKADAKWLAKFATNNGTTNESWRNDGYYGR